MKKVLFAFFTLVASVMACPFIFLYGGFATAKESFSFWKRSVFKSGWLQEKESSAETEKKVVNFIKRRFPIDSRWTCGNCYFFALILKDAFGGTILYDEIKGHFVCEINGTPYDYNGVYENKDGFLIEWEELKKEDPLYSERLVRDCCR